MTPTIIFGGIVLIVLIYIFALYNALVTLRVRIKEAWSGIEVQLKRRSSLIPNLIETVKGYAKHEKSVFENVTKARSAMLSAKNPRQAAAAENMLTGALKTLFAVAEDYPDLKASDNFKELQEELSDTETKIAASRQFYNSNVMEYNTKIQVFPSILIARLFNFQKEDFFEADEAAKEEIKVKF
ncbi:MAG: LemA family protein [Candidatus Curtissbacteria bacterium GW2011_GWA1_40_24]|uniref:LemA family protein n=1 Tax=Candidatus Curtissbacteria bacterium GW2011_GWA1_40_24 TaxID=1618406 RepID=A0A0G0RWT5_9BACT|nr:MAG: LemA family protein [Candidatus Curtissbacteria bacterium GW2011_GWA1_40_24]